MNEKETDSSGITKMVDLVDRRSKSSLGNYLYPTGKLSFVEIPSESGSSLRLMLYARCKPKSDIYLSIGYLGN